MGLLRNALLIGSESTWLRERARSSRVVRRSMSRFMPGEQLDDALRGARELCAHRIATIFSHLGENVTHRSEADEVTHHYLDVLERIKAAGLNTHISVKPTQLGLDLDSEQCYRNLVSLVARSAALGNFVWIDMEGSAYTDRTLSLFKELRQGSPHVGICLQAYLHRTCRDIDDLLTLGPAIRLVKGAYREPAALTFRKKHDVDENYFRLAVRLLDAAARRCGTFVGLATHDPRLVSRLVDYARRSAIPPDCYEFEMLFGIQRGLQRRLQQDGQPVRVLIAYGEQWFPWYMRRLAERPANLLFVAKNLFT